MIVYSLTMQNPDGFIAVCVKPNREDLKHGVLAAMEGWVDKDFTKIVDMLTLDEWVQSAEEEGFTPEVSEHELEVAEAIPGDLRLSFTPDAIREHFDDGDEDPWFEALTEEQLAEVGRNALDDDRLYKAFHEALVEALSEVKK